jgi:S-adenosylmethionine synthetase
MLETAAYGHMGRTQKRLLKLFSRWKQKTVTVELFTWKKLDFVDQVKLLLVCNSI